MELIRESMGCQVIRISRYISYTLAPSLPADDSIQRMFTDSSPGIKAALFLSFCLRSHNDKTAGLLTLSHISIAKRTYTLYPSDYTQVSIYLNR